MSRLFFNASFPADLRGKISSLLVQLEWMLPLWVQRCDIQWEATNSHAIAQCEVMPDYRIVRITIAPLFLEFDELRQYEFLTHEMVHCFNLPLAVLAREITDMLCETGSQLHTVLNKQIDEKMEMITQDMSYVLAKRLKGARNG